MSEYTIIFILPLMLAFVHGILQLYYSYIFRGVYKADSAFFHFFNAIIFSYLIFSAYETGDQTTTGLVLAVMTFIIFIVIYYATVANRITVHNGSLEETIQLIEEKLEQDHIPYEKNEFSYVNDLMKFEINEGREYIEVKYKKSWLNENYKYTMTVKSKLKERAGLLEDIILDLRDMRRDRSFKRRILVEFLSIIVFLAAVILFFVYFNP